MALEGVSQFRVPSGRLRFLGEAENATYAFDTSSPLSPRLRSPYHASRVLVRLHRPGREYRRQIESETAWLSDLRASGLVVPQPVPLRGGGLVGRVSHDGHTRHVTVMRWIEGSRCRIPDARRLYLTGRLMARMHEHSDTWKPPRGFVRMHWTWDEFFGESKLLIHPASELWALLPKKFEGKAREVAEATRALYPDKVSAGRPYGLVHADLHSRNTLMHRGEVYPIDFDDCGFAYHVMDFANTLSQVVRQRSFWTLADAFLRGYREVRPFPEEEWRRIGLAMAARCASNLLWLVDKSLINADFRSRLGEMLARDADAMGHALRVHQTLHGKQAWDWT